MNDEIIDFGIRISGDPTGAVNAYRAQTEAGTQAAVAAERAGQVSANAAKKAAAAQLDVGKKAFMAGGLILAGLALAVSASMKFQKQMSEVGAVSNASSAQMRQLSAAALKAGADTVFSANDAAKAEAELAKGGLKVADIIGGGLTGAMNLASAGQLEVARAAEITATALSQFSLKGDQASHVADLLAAGANKALGSVDDLAQGLKYVGPVAASMGVSIDQTVGVLAEFAQAGIKGEQGGTSLRGVISSLTSPSAMAAAEMSKLGISVFDASGKFLGLDGVAGQLHQALSGLTEAERSNALGRIFGNQQVTAARVLYEGGAKSVNDWTTAVNQNGYAADLARKKMDNLSGDLENLRGSIDTALIKGGSTANGTLRVLTQTVTGLINGFGALPGPVQAAITIIMAVTGVVALLGGGAMVAAVKIRALRDSLEAMGTGGARASSAIGTMGSVLGKLAAPIAIATVAYGIWSQKQAEAKQKTDDFTRAIEADSGAIGNNARALAAHQIQSSGAAAAANKMHIPLNLVTDAALGNTAALGQVIKAAEEYKRQGGDNGTATKFAMGLGEVAVAAQKGSVAQKEVAAATKVTAEAATTATSAATAHAAALKAQKDAATATAKGIRDLSDALRAQTDPLFAVADALTKQRDAQAAASKAMKDHGRTSAEYATANLEAFKATVDVSSAVRQMKASLLEGKTSLKAVNAQLDSYVKAGLLSASQSAALKTQVAGVVTTTDKLAGSLGVVVPHVKTAGKDIGKGLGDGIIEGLAKSMPKIVKQAQTMGAAAVGAARQGAQVFSPSKATIYVGQMLGEGLIVGMTSKIGDVQAAATALAHAATGAAAGAGTVNLADLKAAQARANQTPIDKARLDDLNAAAAVDAARAKSAAANQAVAKSYDTYATAAHKAAAADAVLAAAKKGGVQAATDHARALRAAADAASMHAKGMPAVTAAQQAAKKAAEAHAAALAYQAREAGRAATTLREHGAASLADAKAAASAADAAAKKAKDAYLSSKKGAADAAKALTDALAQASQAHAALADAVYADTLTKAQAFTSSISSRLDALVTKANDMRSSFSGAALNQSSLQDLFAVPDGGVGITSVTGAINALQQRVDAAKNLADQMQQLQAAGLSDTLVKQISDAGTTAGAQMAQAILAGGPEAIASLNDLSMQLATVANSGLDQVVSGFYGQGASALAQLAEGMRAGFPELDAVLAEIAGKVASVYGTAPVPASTGTKAVPAHPPSTGWKPAPVMVHITVAPQGLVTGSPKEIAEALAPSVRDAISGLNRIGA